MSSTENIDNLSLSRTPSGCLTVTGTIPPVVADCTATAAVNTGAGSSGVQIQTTGAAGTAVGNAIAFHATFDSEL